MKLFRVKATARQIHSNTTRRSGGSITPAALQSMLAERQQQLQDSPQIVGGAPQGLVNTTMSLSAHT